VVITKHMRLSTAALKETTSRDSGSYVDRNRLITKKTMEFATQHCLSYNSCYTEPKLGVCGLGQPGPTRRIPLLEYCYHSQRSPVVQCSVRYCRIIIRKISAIILCLGHGKFKKEMWNPRNLFICR